MPNKDDLENWIYEHKNEDWPPTEPWDVRRDLEKEKRRQEEDNVDWIKQMQEAMKKNTQSQYVPPRDPIDVLRDEMREELRGIKDAIRKIGIMLDEDAPSEEMMEKHKMLRDAYNKYKMIETLILGEQSDG